MNAGTVALGIVSENNNEPFIAYGSYLNRFTVNGERTVVGLLHKRLSLSELYWLIVAEVNKGLAMVPNLGWSAMNGNNRFTRMRLSVLEQRYVS